MISLQVLYTSMWVFTQLGVSNLHQVIMIGTDFRLYFITSWCKIWKNVNIFIWKMQSIKTFFFLGYLNFNASKKTDNF